MEMIHEIIEADIGKGVINKWCLTCGTKHPIHVHDLMGCIQSIDVGKRIYRSKAGLLYVENQEQLRARTKPITTGLLVAWTLNSILCKIRD